jgi:O-antigen/teichoic acid export membrane protein
VDRPLAPEPAPASTSRRQYRNWLGQGAFAIVEQGGFSASSFIVSVLLARWTPAPVFGAFAVAFTIFLILAGIHNAFLLEPMSVLGPARYGDRPHRYLQSQLRIHLKVTLPMAAAVLASSALIHLAQPGSPLAGAMLGMGLALPAILLIWTTRLAAYVVRRPPVALGQTLIYGTVTVAAMLVLKVTHHVSGQSAFCAVGLAALIGSLPMWLVLRRGAATEPPDAPSPGHDHWVFGRWVAVAGVIGNLGSQCQGFLVVVILDLGAAGQLRAVLLLALPMAQVLNAVTTVALPRLSRLHGEGRDKELVRRCFLLGWCMIPIAVCFVIGLAVLSHPLESLLYHGRYAKVAWLFPVAGLQVVFAAMAVGPTLALRATEQPRVYLIGGSIQAVVTVTATFVLGLLFGLPGVVASTVVFYATGLAASYALYRRWARGNPLTFDFVHATPTSHDRVSGSVLR